MLRRDSKDKSWIDFAREHGIAEDDGYKAITKLLFVIEVKVPDERQLCEMMRIIRNSFKKSTKKRTGSGNGPDFKCVLEISNKEGHFKIIAKKRVRVVVKGWTQEDERLVQRYTETAMSMVRFRAILLKKLEAAGIEISTRECEIRPR